MRKMLVALLLICTTYVTQAQTQCDSLSGNWSFVRWQTDQMLLDTEDSAATVQSGIQRFRDANNGTAFSAADSLEIVKEVSTLLNSIKTNGLISFTLNKDKTFSWKGSLNGPNEQFSGTYTCKGKTISFIAKNKQKAAENMVLEIVSFNKNTITLLFPPAPEQGININKMTFKRK